MLPFFPSLLTQLTNQVSKQKEICLCYPDTHPVPKITPLPKAVTKRRAKKKAAPPEESKPKKESKSEPLVSGDKSETEPAERAELPDDADAEEAEAMPAPSEQEE